MALKIHEYPTESLTFNDDDFYDIDSFDGITYSTAKIKGSTIKAGISNDPSGWTTIVKQFNDEVTGNVDTNDSEFFFSVVTGGVYMVEFNLATSGASSSADYIFRFSHSVGNMNGAGNVICRNASNSHGVYALYALNQPVTTLVVVGQNGGGIPISSGVISASGTFTFYSSNNGTVNFKMRTSSVGTTARTWKGSILKYKRID